MTVDSWLNHVWYERSSPPGWLMPLAGLYGLLSGMRRFAYARRFRRSTRLPCPVIVVGNVSVGGTGKTPLVCWLVERLSERGYRPGVVTRGYGGSARHVRQVTAADEPAVVGDEPVLLARRSGAPVAIGRDRPAAAQLLIAVGCDVIVSDDGLQHYALARDCEIVVVDGDRRFGNGWLLPAGPLRESPMRARTADAVVINGGRAPREAAFGMRLEAKNAVAVVGGEVLPLSALVGHTIHAIAAIGNPQRFFNMLRSRGIEVLGRPLADHATLSRSDIEFGDDKPVLMTEKDAVKCSAFAGRQHWYVPVSAQFDAVESPALLDIVIKKITHRDAKSQGLADG
jgi:tetraacyldisaccharide 4'-kinase